MAAESLARTMPLPLYDAHNHLQDDWLTPHFDRIARQLGTTGLQRTVVNGTCESDWERVIALSRHHTWIIPSVGLHPWHSGNRSGQWRETLIQQLNGAAHPFIGEIGLDRWILDRAGPDDVRLAGLRRAPMAEQLDVFKFQLSLAAEHNLPATIHCLDAWGSLDDIVRHAPLPARGWLLHAYSGSTELIETFAARGAYFSFNGSFLGDRKERQRETFKHVPLDRLLIETDAPAMSLPPAWRTFKLPPSPDGQPVNHPANIEAAYAGLAALLGMSLASLAAQIEKNFRRLFGFHAELTSTPD